MSNASDDMGASLSEPDDSQLVSPPPTDLGPVVADSASRRPQTEPFDPTEARERLRGRLAMLGVAIFAGTILLLVVPVIAGWRTWNEIQGLAAAVLPAVSTIVSSAMVFYYSATNRER
jgi:hypothetical protein